MKCRVLLLTVFAVLAGTAFFAARTRAEPNQVKYVTQGVWFREGDLEGQGHSNNIIIEMKDYLIVVDANFPSGARAALADVRRISDKPVKYVFDTHHHGDHAYGNPIWTEAGATTLAYVGVVEEMQRYEPTRWQERAQDPQGCGGSETRRAGTAETDLRQVPLRAEGRYPRSAFSITTAGRIRAAMASSTCPRKRYCAPATRWSTVPTISPRTPISPTGRR